MHAAGSARLPGPAGCLLPQRPHGRRDEETYGRQHRHGRARGADEELDGLWRPGLGAVHEADDRRRLRGSQEGRMSETIFAPATAAGRAAVAVVRISGPETKSTLRALVGRLPKP